MFDLPTVGYLGMSNLEEYNSKGSPVFGGLGFFFPLVLMSADILILACAFRARVHRARVLVSGPIVKAN